MYDWLGQRTTSAISGIILCPNVTPVTPRGTWSNYVLLRHQATGTREPGSFKHGLMSDHVGTRLFMSDIDWHGKLQYIILVICKSVSWGIRYQSMSLYLSVGGSASDVSARDVSAGDVLVCDVSIHVASGSCYVGASDVSICGVSASAPVTSRTVITSHALSLFLILRAVNTALLDTYQLKSLDAILEASIEEMKIVKVGDRLKVQVSPGPTGEDNYVHTFDNFALREPFDVVIQCLGFLFDDSIFAK